MVAFSASLNSHERNFLLQEMEVKRDPHLVKVQKIRDSALFILSRISKVMAGLALEQYPRV